MAGWIKSIAERMAGVSTQRWLELTAGISLLARLVLWVGYPVIPLHDTASYRRSAEAILAGWVQYDGTRTPGYPGFLALVGPDQSAYLAQLALGFLTGLLFFYIGWKLTGRGWFAALVSLAHTFNLGQLFFEANLMTETLTTFLLASVWALLAFLFYEKPALPLAAAAAFLAGTFSGLAFLVRPLFGFLPFWVAFFLVAFWAHASWKARWASALAALLPGVLIVAAWVNFIHARFGNWGLNTMSGYHLVQHTGVFFELVPDEHAAIRDTYLEYRDERIAQVGAQVNTIWDAIPELQQVSGLGFYSLSERLAQISVQLIREHPELYLRNVVRGWGWFWKVPFYWSPGEIGSPVMVDALRVVVFAQRGLLFGGNLLFMAGTLAVILWKQARRRLGMDPYLWFLLGAVWLTALLQSLPDHGDNPRFSVPVQSLVVLMVFYWATNLIRWKERGTASAKSPAR